MVPEGQQLLRDVLCGGVVETPACRILGARLQDIMMSYEIKQCS